MKGNPRFFLFIFIFCLLPLKLNAAEKSPFSDPKITISMDLQDARLKDILKMFSMQSGLNFIASEAVQERKITLYLDKVPIKEVMDKLFKANNLSYELDSKAKIFIVKDWGIPQIETVTTVFPLKYATVSSSSLKEEMAQTQRRVSTSSSYSSTTATSGTTAARSGKWKSEEEVGITETVKKLLSANGVVIEDYRTNSLIVRDIPSRMPIIAQTIALLDVPVTQVLIEVEMLDVNKNIVDKLGFEFGNNPLTLILPGEFQRRGAELFFGAKSSREAEGGLTLGRTYARALDFLRTQTDTKYLARPKLLTLNNEPAEISITKDEVVGKKETTVVPTTGGSTSTVEYIRSTDLALTKEGTGIYLRVTPQVNPETNEITMLINPKTSITNTSALFSTQADAEVRSTKSIVKVKDGETVMLGGIIHTDKSVVTKKLPILGDIPFLGALFRHKNKSKDIERELIVFITPHIIKDKGLEFVQTKKDRLSSRGQAGVLASERQATINSSLNSLEKIRNN